MSTDIKVPTLGESVVEATIAKWLKNEGDAVKADEPLVELETDKVAVEVPAPVSGKLEKIIVLAGATVNVGALLGTIAEGAAGAATAAPTKAAAPAPSLTPAPAARLPNRPLSPAVRKAVARMPCQPRRYCRHGQGWPPHQGGCGGPCGQARRCTCTDTCARGGFSAGRSRRSGGRGGARAHDPASRHHRAPPEGSAEHGRHADHLQRGGHDGGHGAPQPVQGCVRERSTA